MAVEKTEEEPSASLEDFGAPWVAVVTAEDVKPQAETEDSLKGHWQMKLETLADFEVAFSRKLAFEMHLLDPENSLGQEKA